MTPDPGGAREPGCFTPIRDLPRAWGDTPAHGLLKQRIDDFAVDEVLGFEPDGEGPHAWLLLRKRDTNTRWLAGALARLAGVPRHAVGFAGLKDRAAVTTQWFSVPVEGRTEPDWTGIVSANVALLRVTRHRRKLRRGIQQGNRFSILVRDARGDGDAVAERARQVSAGGVPNYFGEQRFGRDGGNIDGAWQMLTQGRRVRDRGLRGLYLSAARSMLFNRVLAERVSAGTWNRVLPGEMVMLDGTHSIFPVTVPDTDIIERCAAMDLHPTGPMGGRGEPMATDVALAAETAALTGCEPWCEGLAAAGLDAARRALRIRLTELEVGFEASDRLRVSFVLPAGAYATMAIRELVTWQIE